MKQIRALQVLNWIQDPKIAKTIEVLVVLKSATLSRIDDEVIEVNEKAKIKQLLKQGILQLVFLKFIQIKNPLKDVHCLLKSLERSLTCRNR
jgi:hypothetical protein